MHEIKDKYGRRFQSLRVSLTSVCNLKCVYCVPSNMTSTKDKGVLDYISLSDLVLRIYQALEIQDLRITGGEPTVYPYFMPFVKRLHANGLRNIKLTTNALRLFPFIEELRANGVTEVNISLDSLDKENFKAITQKDNIKAVLAAIEECLRQDMQVKINMVVMKGINHQEVIPMLEYCMQRNISVRFLELMRMGHLYSGQFDTYFYGQEQILEQIADRYPVQYLGRALSATSQYWQMEGGYKFGVIANESVPFCNDCNRLRLDSKGHLYGCLSKNDYIDISQANDPLLYEAFRQALAHKQAHKFVGSDLSMKEIGG